MSKSATSHRSVRRSLAAAALLAIVAVAGLQGTASADSQADAARAASPANPMLSNQASSGWYAGMPIYTSGTLSGGVNPTGYITYVVYGPDDATCSRPAAWVTFTHVFGNGFYQSAWFVSNAAGTYRWIAWYSGDANNNPTAISACDAPSGAAYVSKRNVTLSGSASPVSAAGTITNTATLGSGSGPSGPTGTITFNLYGPDNMTCAGAPIFSSVETVAGNGGYTSDPFKPTVAGKYAWTVAYSGDANNNSQFTGCDPTNSVTYAGAGTVVTAGASSVRPGGSLTVTWSGVSTPTARDVVGLYPVGGSTAVAMRYTYNTTSGSTVLTVPATAALGSYEVRLGTAKSGVVTVY